VAVRANQTGAYQDTLLIGAPAVSRGSMSPTLRREAALAYSILSPTLVVILFLVAYPFFAAIYLSLQSKMVGAPARFVGFDNYVELFRDEVFLRTAWNSVVYTVVAVGLKFVIGLTMALILDQNRRFNNFFRTLLFVPRAVPVVIVALNWRWIYDDLSGFLNNFLITFHITKDIISWLSDPALAMGCVIAVVVWSGTPFSFGGAGEARARSGEDQPFAVR
jgi:multiple sugar transport system permease protein